MTVRHDTLLQQLSHNTLSPAELTKASKEASSLSSATRLYSEWRQCQQELEQVQLMLTEQDQSIVSLAEEELQELTARWVDIERQLVVELAPKDTADAASAILEIRPGAGGDEAILFSGEMARMYERFSQINRWKWEVLSGSTDRPKENKEMIINITGKNVFGMLRYETGVHRQRCDCRVQRVPTTETQGRVHTSTVTVAMMPQPTEVDIQIKESDLRIDVYRASGAGGQHVNTTDSAVRMTHLPTGLTVSMQDERSQHKNKAKALKVLRAKIYDVARQETDLLRRNSRNQQIGTGDRSEKIRTYNFPQNRVTDHRINLTLYELEPVLTGEGLSRVIEPLQEHYLAASLLA
ncbi:peptide chain release factor 1 [Spinellus fusiger]|nr:peptide chain release factor 1 [Spinellus fusiger]